MTDDTKLPPLPKPDEPYTTGPDDYPEYTRETLLAYGNACAAAALASAAPAAGWSDDQVMEFGALCVMNRRSNKTAREMLAEFRKARTPAAPKAPAADALTEQQAHTIACADSWLELRGLPTYSQLRAATTQAAPVEDAEPVAWMEPSDPPCYVQAEVKARWVRAGYEHLPSAYSVPLYTRPAAPEAPSDAQDAAELIVREVAELPDRNSPEDWPEAMLVTADELRAIVIAAIAASEAGKGAGR